VVSTRRKNYGGNDAFGRHPERSEGSQPVQLCAVLSVLQEVFVVASRVRISGWDSSSQKTLLRMTVAPPAQACNAVAT